MVNRPSISRAAADNKRCYVRPRYISCIFRCCTCDFTILGLSLVSDAQPVVCHFFALARAKKWHTIKAKYHAAAGESPKSIRGETYGRSSNERYHRQSQYR